MCDAVYPVALTGMLDADSVIRDLQRYGSLTVKLGPFTNVWTPERPRRNHLPMGFYQMPGRGLLTYTLEPDGETVHLRWQPKKGPAREWTGPIPVVATPGFRAESRRGTGVALVAFVVIEGLGALGGLLGGSILGGLGAGLVGGYLVTMTMWGDGQQRAFIHAHEQLRHPHPEPEAPAVPEQKPSGESAETQAQHEPDSRLAPHRKHERILRVAYTIYALLLVLGFVLGYFLTGGSPGRRFVAGTIGIVVAMGLVIAATEIMRGGRAIKRGPRSGHT